MLPDRPETAHPLLHPRAATPLVVAGLAIVAIVHLLLFWPGILVWDAIRQYGQALSGRYDDWHPPAMNWLWRQLLPLHDGPVPMLVVQVLLYWGGFGLLALAALRRGCRGSAVAFVFVALWPIPLVLVGTVLKDSLMAGLLVLAIGLGGIGGRPARIAAAALLLGAATLRFNAVPACLPLVWPLLPAAWGWRRRAAAAAVALVLLVAAMPLANRMLQARRSGVELSLVIYDLAGITRYAGVDAFPPLPMRGDPVRINARCYDPVSWDRYAWWGKDPCPINFAPVRTAFEARGEGIYRPWLRAIAAHPLAYARHRIGHFSRNTRLTADAALPTLSLRSDPNPWGFALPTSGARDAIGAVAQWSLGTPLGWPICWLALGIGLLVLVPVMRAPGRVVPVLASGLLYGFSYLPLSVASEVRYHLWTMLAVAIAAIFAAGEIALGRTIARGRLALAATPAIGMTALAIGVRLIHA